MGDYAGSSVYSMRIQSQTKQREKEKKDFEALKEEKERNAAQSRLLGFAKAKGEMVEQAFKRDTVGLQTAKQFQDKKNNIEKELEMEANLRRRAAEEAELRERQKKRTKKKKATARLSFEEDEDEDEDEDEAAEDAPPEKKAKSLKFGSLGKNPHVVTGFLPDRDRDREERALREQLKAEWEASQQAVKDEILEITYSYWDGAGHRKTIRVTKGDTIGVFLRKVRDQLKDQFREMRNASVDNMLYIKEDLIIPHDMSFHFMIVNKCRGKSGPLFNFDVHEDIRVTNDASVEKDESHAGKVVERHWYDKNKHIFPASRWEIFDPNKDYGSYTIHGDE